MADGYALALQVALISYLPTVPTVAGLVSARIYDEPPQNAERPYICINSIDPAPVRSSCGKAANVIFSLEAHSRPNSGRVEATRCAEALTEALDGHPLSVERFETVYLRWLTQTVDRDEDGEGYSAIVVFETLLDT